MIRLHRTWRHLLVLLMLFAVLCLLPAPASAQVETIGPVVVVTNQTVDYRFPNETIPPPNRKVIDFLGSALNQTTNTVQLQVIYDYIDPATGAEVISPLNNPIVIPPGGPHPVDPGPWILDFCPEEVSLHFRLEGTGEIEVSGEFGHTCVIPEPSGLGLAAVGLVALGLIRRRAA